MRALVFDTTLGGWEKTRGFELRDVPKPELNEKKNPADADKVLLNVHYAGICGTDRGIWNRAAFKDQILGSLAAEKAASPARDAGSSVGDRRILGHEFFGEVVALGSRAPAIAPFPLRVGDFAAPESHVTCNKCFQCLHGEKHVCTNEKILGISHDGGFAEFVKLPAHILWKTDTGSVRPELGALQEPFGNAVHAASKVSLKGKTIAIFGLGPIGLFLVLVARGLGAASIIGVEPNPVSQDMAKKLGIDYIIPLPQRPKDTPTHHRNEDVIARIEELTSGLGADVSFEMAGFNSSFNNCVFATRRGGDMIAFGIKSGDFVLEDYNRFIVRGITMHAVIGRRLPETWEMTQRLFMDAQNKIQENIWNVILNQGKGTILPLAKYTREAFEAMMAKHPKILIEV
ncbi:MAG: alcohol dehydrogenase catalytic domain-containing protein [Patescibacteria group bacterium]|mgnify:FL=1